VILKLWDGGGERKWNCISRQTCSCFQSLENFGIVVAEALPRASRNHNRALRGRNSSPSLRVVDGQWPRTAGCCCRRVESKDEERHEMAGVAGNWSAEIQLVRHRAQMHAVYVGSRQRTETDCVI